MLYSVFGLHPYLANNAAWSMSQQAAFASLAYPMFTFGASMFVAAALVGRAEFVRFFYGGELWLLFRSLAYPIYLYQPIYSLTYFLSMSTA